MALAVHQFSVVDDDGKVVPNASIEVRQEITGSPIAVLFSDRAGVVSLGNPFNADGEGFAQFFVAGGAYRVTATSGAFSRVWRYVAVGTAAESDIEDFVSGAGTVVDQSVIRADGTTGTSLQGSNVLLDDSGNMFFPEGSRLEWQTGSPPAQDVRITHSLNGLAFTGAANGYTFDNALEITPPAASLVRGIDVVQSGPTSGSAGANLFFNRILPDASNVDCAGGDVVGLEVRMGTGGANADGQRIAMVGYTVQNTATGSTDIDRIVYCGVSGIGQGSTNDGGTSTAGPPDSVGYVLGMNAVGILNGGATNYLHLAGLEVLTSMRAGSSVAHHVGARIVQFFDHAESGALLDAGLQFLNQAGAVGWQDYGIVFDGSSVSAGTLFKASATIIGVTGTPTVTHGIDFQSVSFSGAAFRSFGFFVNGGGEVVSAKHTGGLGATSNLTLQSTEGVGTTDFIDFKVGNAGATRAARILNNGKIIVNGSASVALAQATEPRLQVLCDDANGLGVGRFSNGATGANLALSKSRNATVGSHTVVTSGDTLGIIRFCGSDGDSFEDAAIIEGRSDGTPGAGDMPGMLSFQTTPDGSTTALERMRIDSRGNVVTGGGAVATNATDGFLYIPTCAGTPTGTPTTHTGRAAMVFNSSANTLHVYSGGAWRTI